MTQNKHPLSVVMIVKNEAHNLALSLPAVAEFADEIIVLDSGSTDNSREIVEKFGGKWYVNTNWQGFGKQRQIAQSYATGEWILALDADEVVTNTLKNSILQVIKNQPDNHIYGLRCLDFVFGHQIDHPLWRIKPHWRLYPKSFQFDDNLVHESVVLNGAKTISLGGFLQHHTAPTPKFWLEKRLRYATAWADDRYHQGKKGKFYKVLLNPLWAFIKQYVLDGRFLQGRYGLIYALLFVQYTFNKYVCLYYYSTQHTLLLSEHLKNAQTWATQEIKTGKQTSFFAVLTNPLWQFIHQYWFDGRFLQGRYGLIYSLIFCQYTFNKYLLLYQHNKTHTT